MSGYRRAKVTIDCFILETSHGVVYLSTTGVVDSDGLFGSIGVTEQPLPDCVTIEHLPDLPTFTDGDVIQFRANRDNGVWTRDAGRWFRTGRTSPAQDGDAWAAWALSSGSAVRLTPEVTS